MIFLMHGSRTVRKAIALPLVSVMTSVLFAGLLAASAVHGQDTDRTIDKSERSLVIDALVERVQKIYVLPDVARQMGQSMRDRDARGEYNAITSGNELAKALTRDLRAICKDSHLDVQCFAKGILYDSEQRPDPKEVEKFRRTGARRNYQFRRVERLDGGIGLLQVDGFYPAEWITETAAGAMAFLANSESIILDLRQNSGGQSGGVLLCSYFFQEDTHLSDFYNRAENSTRQSWTYPVAGSEKIADKNLYILTSNRTFSAAEALAYDLQALKRATIVGETTGGGAHGTTAFRITDHFSASIPFCRSINAVTKGDWEGTGVKPDVPVPAEQALLTAHVLALNKSLAKHADEPELADELRRIIAAKEQELHALKAK